MSAAHPFELLLFTAVPEVAAAAHAAGIDGVVVDLEHRGKVARQVGADTEVNRFTPAHVARCREATTGHLVCRINAVGDWTADEVAAVIADGADEVLVPMIRTPDDVTPVIDMVGGRAQVGALVETPQAVETAPDIAALGLSRVYLGLNDLAIARRSPNLFTAIADGTVETVAQAMAETGTPFGFAGLTLPDRGHPVPCRLLIGEMVGLGCRHAFMRRSFLRDVPVERFAEGVAEIRAALATAALRTAAQRTADREDLVTAISQWSDADASSDANVTGEPVHA